MLQSKQALADKLLNHQSEVQLTELSNDELLKSFRSTSAAQRQTSDASFPC
jgi:hypothetical protein